MENKNAKYLKYALGEIVLVVIGILIALQVNEWNSERQKAKTEISYLREIKTNLEDDLSEIENVKRFNGKKAKAIDTVFKIFQQSSDPTIYVPMISDQMYTLTEFDVFVPNRIAFDNMVSSESIDLINNKELRNSLSIYYKKDFSSSTQERVKELTRNFTDYAGEVLLNRHTIKNLTNYDSNIRQMSEVSLHDDEVLYSSLFSMFMIIDGHNNLLDITEKEIKDLLALLELNLNNLDD